MYCDASRPADDKLSRVSVFFCCKQCSPVELRVVGIRRVWRRGVEDRGREADHRDGGATCAGTQIVSSRSLTAHESMKRTRTTPSPRTKSISTFLRTV